MSIEKKKSKKLQELEAILILENGLIEETKLSTLLQIQPDKLEELIEKKNQLYNQSNSILFIQKKKNQYELFFQKNFSSPILNHFRTKKKPLSSAIIEVLTIIAYKQPITKLEIDEIRGINNTSYLKQLIEEKLVCMAGKKKAPGNPTLFKTTEKFLKQFGLNSLKELPPLKDIKTYSFLEKNYPKP